MKIKLLPLVLVLFTVAASGQQTNTLKDLNVEFMLRGYFYAGSRIDDKKAGSVDNVLKIKREKPDLGQRGDFVL